jgi:CheY-like chemotaxis protein
MHFYFRMSAFGQTRVGALLISEYQDSHMPHTVVLMVGRDRVLVETRSQVLRTAGYIVVPAYTPRQAIDEFVRGDFDLVLLCHSMPEDARERLVSVIREHTSRTPIVSVASFDGQFDGFADATIENDPNLLIDSLRKIVSRNSDSSGGVQRRPAA